MKRALLTVAAIAATVALTVPGSAGPDKIKFPEGWKSHVLSTTVDRYDVKQYRAELAVGEPARDADLG